MCGIVGILAHRKVAKLLMAGLRTLEYRGYDSAGVALLVNGKFAITRAAGKLANLRLQEEVDSEVGIGHTRWATHGGATEANAHPHAVGRVAVVHNGIVENFAELRNQLEEEGAIFQSETDTEVISQLISKYYEQGLSRPLSISNAFKRIRGSFAVCVVFSDAPEELYAAARGSPLVVGLAKKHQNGVEQNEFFVASDPLAVAAVARWFLYLKDGEIVHMSQAGANDKLDVTDFDLKPVESRFEENRLSAETATKTGFAHYMLKEINEQPTAIVQSVHAAGILAKQRHAELKAFFSDRLTLVACGTSHHACLVARHFFEKYARVPCQCELASEFLYRAPVVSGSYIFVSQSGETRDTVAAHDMVSPCRTLAVVNVSTSQLARRAGLVFTTQAGPEIGVASTKAFTSQIAVLLSLLMEVLDGEQLRAELKNEINLVSARLQEFIQATQNDCKNYAAALKEYKQVIYLGRGATYPIAMEGALKLKEICYIGAQAYAAGELKHGPIALVDQHMPVVVFVSSNNIEKMASNIQEVVARGGMCIVVLSYSSKKHFENIFSPKSSRLHSLQVSPDQSLAKVQYIQHPDCGEVGEVFFQSAVLQLLAYHTAVELGVDVDQPRNLAKCVTVE